MTRINPTRGWMVSELERRGHAIRFNGKAFSDRKLKKMLQGYGYTFHDDPDVDYDTDPRLAPDKTCKGLGDTRQGELF